MSNNKLSSSITRTTCLVECLPARSGACHVAICNAALEPNVLAASCPRAGLRPLSAVPSD